MDQTTLSALQSSLRRLVPDSISDTFAELKKHLPEFSSKFSALLLLESRLNAANLQNIEGTISEDDLQLRYNQIRADLLLFINGLEVSDFSLPLAGAPAAKTGSLLYKIPTKMTLQKETKCVVRLAFEKESIIRNIELNSDVQIKSVRVAEVMQVELIDPTEPHPFAIRTISDEEQFVEKGDYSEWCFYVKPLLEGTFPLVLKISVLEVVMGKERLRNLTYEENIQITATAAAEKEPDFKPLGISIAAKSTTEYPGSGGEGASAGAEIPGNGDDILIAPPVSESQALEPALVMPATPYTPLPAVPIQREAEPPIPSPETSSPQILPPKRRNPITWMTAAASVLLIVTVAIFSINNNASSNKETKDFPSNVVQDSATIIPDIIYRDTLIPDTIK